MIFKVVISENYRISRRYGVCFWIKSLKQKLKIIKDDEQEICLVPNTEFLGIRFGQQKYVEQVTAYPSTTVHKSYFTDEKWIPDPAAESLAVEITASKK